MEKSLRDYIMNVEKEYAYVMKFATEITDKHLDKIEKMLKKYDVLEVSPIKKTIIQKNPIDFVGVENAEIYMFNVKTRLPASPQLLIQELKKVLNIAEKLMVVRNINDPLELQNKQLVDYRENTDYSVRLADPNYSEVPKIDGSELYGDKRNKELVKHHIDSQKNKNPQEYKKED